MRIGADTASMASAILRHWHENQRVMLAAAERISTGTTMSRPVDDAAGVAIAERMRARLESGFQAHRNVQDGISAIDVADGALSSMTELIQQMRVLALQSANGTFDDTARGYLQTGVVHTLDELDAIVERTRVAGRSILKGADLTIQTGPDAGASVSVTFDPTDRTRLGVGGIDISTQQGATSALDALDAAIEQLVEQRAKAAAVHQQFERITAELSRSGIDHAMALSRSSDVDIAHEAVQMARAHLLTDVAAGLMTEVTRVQRSVLELLRPLDLEPAQPAASPGPDAPTIAPTAPPPQIISAAEAVASTHVAAFPILDPPAAEPGSAPTSMIRSESVGTEPTPVAAPEESTRTVVAGGHGRLDSAGLDH